MSANGTPLRPPRRRYRPVVGPRQKRFLAAVFGLFALLSVNAAYLLGVRILEAASGETYQNWLYLNMFLVHLFLGALIVLPVIAFGITHFLRARDRPNRRAVRVGYALFITALLLLASGVVLTRLEGIIEVKDPAVRSAAFWIHLATPVIAGWLFVLHRLAGKRIRWRVGRRWAAVAGIFAAGMVLIQAQDPRRWNVEGPASGERYFFPSLARTATGDFIPERVLMNDAYCRECHGDVHERWSASAHRFSSFNNPAYLFSVSETRAKLQARDGDTQGSRFCAGCHDPVVLFSGKFDDPRFDNSDLSEIDDPAASAGITCTSCHAITHINSPRGNADFTVEEPLPYPFAFSKQPLLASLNRQLVKAKPELHKKTFLKPLHRSTEFCGACHKVHLPQELNDYKWLRGQNHYDSFLLSGVSGHGVSSFYYPEKAVPNCQQCHMEPRDSDDFGARDLDGSGKLQVHDHLFPSANTALPYLLGLDPRVIDEHRRFNEGVMRVDLFGIKKGGTLEGELIAPLRPSMPVLEPGASYLLETVIRTVKIGHQFTQGTTDSNEVWLEIVVESGGEVIGRSGALSPDAAGRAVDPWSHFVNVYMLDREGKRIDRRNAEDIFVPLYDHQIPPGAADVVHYRLEVPPGITAPVTIEARLRFRKFDTTFMRHFRGDDGYVNDLPILDLARDRITLPVAGGSPDAPAVETAASPIDEWERWNDYGIGLLRKGGKSKGELRGAEEAFTRVEALGKPDGPLNLARVYLAQGTVQDRAIEALERAATFDPPAPPWSVAWFTGLVNKQNGFLDEAIEAFRGIVEVDDEETRGRGFDFSRDYRLLNELAQTLVERSNQERGEAGKERREALLREAVSTFERALKEDPENVTAHYNLNLAYRKLGDEDKAAEHFEAYNRYRPDDNARDRAVARARAENPAANHAAEAIVIYDLHRPKTDRTGAERAGADR